MTVQLYRIRLSLELVNDEYYTTVSEHSTAFAIDHKFHSETNKLIERYDDILRQLSKEVFSK